MANKFWNIVKANSEIEAAHSALAPALAKAGINSITSDGKAISLDQATIAQKISALISAQPVVADSASAAEALVSNEKISAELEKAETALALKTTAVDGLTRDKAELADKLAKSESAVTDLTGKVSTLTIERDAAVKQFTTNAQALTAQKSALAERCIAANCLDLKGEDGKALDKEAAYEAKLAAAMKLDHGDLFKAYNGAVNAAIAKTGVTFAVIPNAASTPTAQPKAEKKGRERFAASFKVVNA